MLNAQKTAFRCEQTGEEHLARHFIPPRSVRGPRLGTYADANTAVAALLAQKKRGWQQALRRITELNGGVAVDPAARGTLIPAMTESIGDHLRAQAARRKRKPSAAACAADPLAQARREAHAEPPIIIPPAAAATRAERYRLTLVDGAKRSAVSVGDWLREVRERLDLDMTHAFPVHANASGDLTLYPLLACDPQFLRASLSVRVQDSMRT